MQAFIEYSIPVKGLKDGIHMYEFRIDSEFFRNFENSRIADCDLLVELELDKRPDLIILNFLISGFYRDNCDKCLNLIDIAIDAEHVLMIKYGDESESTDEVVFISPLEHALHLEEYIYEFVHLSIPLKKQRDCEAENFTYCDKEMLSRYEVKSSNMKENSIIWDELKNLKL